MSALAELLMEHQAAVVTWPGDEIAPAPLAPAERARVEHLADVADGAIEELGNQSRALAGVLRAVAGGPPAGPADLAAVGILALDLGRLCDAARVLQANAGARLTLADLAKT